MGGLITYLDIIATFLTVVMIICTAVNFLWVKLINSSINSLTNSTTEFRRTMNSMQEVVHGLDKKVAVIESQNEKMQDDITRVEAKIDSQSAHR